MRLTLQASNKLGLGIVHILSFTRGKNKIGPWFHWQADRPTIAKDFMITSYNSTTCFLSSKNCNIMAFLLGYRNFVIRRLIVRWRHLSLNKDDLFCLIKIIFSFDQNATAYHPDSSTADGAPTLLCCSICLSWNPSLQLYIYTAIQL